MTLPALAATAPLRVLQDVAATREAEDLWCSVEKADALATLVLALRPACCVEIGVWRGASALPILLALNANPPDKRGQRGTLIAIDPWSATASTIGEVPENAAWWASVDHDRAFRDFCGRVERAGVRPLCQIIRAMSDVVAPPDSINLLHIDGSHTEQAIRDVERFATHVALSGILVMDDVGWVGNHVERALDRAVSLGFGEIYRIDQCVFMQRWRVTS